MSPANVILDLLRTYPGGTSVQNIMAAGKLFQLEDNAIRVSLSRLVARGVVSKVRRGYYALTNKMNPVNEFVEQWRLGPDRVRPWDKTWLALHGMPGAARRDSTTSGAWVLVRYGFRQVRQALWIRPDNLHVTGEQLASQLVNLGVDDTAVLIHAGRVPDALDKNWFGQFNPAELESALQGMNERLQQSMSRLRTLPNDAARRESFDLGGKAIAMLIRDPLMPDSGSAMIAVSNARNTLWQTMVDYDISGRQVWRNSQEEKPACMPTPLAHTSYA